MPGSPEAGRGLAGGCLVRVLRCFFSFAQIPGNSDHLLGKRGTATSWEAGAQEVEPRASLEDLRFRR